MFLASNLAVLRAQDPFPQVPPGYYPNGQYPNGPPPGGNNPPGEYWRGPVVPTQPAQQTATFGGPGSPDGTDNIRIQPARPFGPPFQPGQPGNGAIPANYLAPGQPRPNMPPTQPKLCEMSLILGRVGDDVVLTGDLLYGVEELIANNAARIPEDKRAEQRAAIMKEVTDGIHEYAAHVAAGDPDPAKGMSDSHRMFIYRMVQQLLEAKMLYQDFRKTVPKEGLEQITERVDRYFEDSQVKILMKRENVTTRAELENALQAKGSSLDRERKIFTEQFVGRQWIMQEVKPEGGLEITHQDMIDWFNAHHKEFEQPAKVRWEELMVSFAKHPHVDSVGFHDEAYAALAAMGNRVIARVPLAEVARSTSDGATAKEGGAWEWTRRGSLDSKTIDDAIFSLPVGNLSPILEAADGYHIVRVVERQEASSTSFLVAQKTVKERIEKERLDAKQKEKIDELRAKYPFWTVFDACMKPAHEPDDNGGDAGR